MNRLKWLATLTLTGGLLLTNSCATDLAYYVFDAAATSLTTGVSTLLDEALVTDTSS